MLSQTPHGSGTAMVGVTGPGSPHRQGTAMEGVTDPVSSQTSSAMVCAMALVFPHRPAGHGGCDSPSVLS